MVRDWKWDYDVKHHITVNAELDLNAFPEASLGGRNQDHKNLCCLCCKLVSAVIIIHSITFWTNYERRKSKRGRLIKCKNAKKTSIVKQYQRLFSSISDAIVVLQSKFIIINIIIVITSRKVFS